MDVLEWTVEMELGNPALDDAHRALFDEMVRLYAAPDSELEEGLPLLCAKLERDFREEEDLMETLNISGVREHREQHARVLSALHHVVVGEPAEAREALLLLPQWFQGHVATMDRALVAGMYPASMVRRDSKGFITL